MLWPSTGWAVLFPVALPRVGWQASLQFAAWITVLVSLELRGIADDVSWLAEIQQPPSATNSANLQKLLIDNAGNSITTLDAWTRKRAELRRQWLNFLGPMPANRPAVKLEIVSEDATAGCRRQLVRYESETGVPVEGYLLRPTTDSPGRDKHGLRPGIVALHQTSEFTIEGIAGVRGPKDEDLGLRLAQQGFIVFCPRCFLWEHWDKDPSANDSARYRAAVDRFRQRHPQTLGMHKMLWDAQRAIDVLVSLTDEVDPKRIGAVGHSLGAKEALYLAAFDDRIAAAVASEGGIGLSFSNWHAPWYLGDAIKAPNFGLDHHQLLALIAPRPFLIVAGETGISADGVRSWPYIAAALPVYRMYGDVAPVGLYNHREGHMVGDQTSARIAEWLRTYLKL